MQLLQSILTIVFSYDLGWRFVLYSFRNSLFSSVELIDSAGSASELGSRMDFTSNLQPNANLSYW